jgi:hypothetical protein
MTARVQDARSTRLYNNAWKAKNIFVKLSLREKYRIQYNARNFNRIGQYNLRAYRAAKVGLIPGARCVKRL